jgi:hypothetical protein
MTTEEPTYSYLSNGTYVRDIFGGYIELPRPETVLPFDDETNDKETEDDL